uniref:Uncharacterized protein n=1 Tax=Arundo donax TaxID=35708 RepID=A0A0A9BGE5_ARUDO
MQKRHKHTSISLWTVGWAFGPGCDSSQPEPAPAATAA